MYWCIEYMLIANKRQWEMVLVVVMVVIEHEGHEGAEETQHHTERSFLRGDRTTLSSRLLFTCSAVGEEGMYPGFTVVNELFENTRPPEDREGDTVPTRVGVEGWSELEVEGASSGDGGKS